MFRKITTTNLCTMVKSRVPTKWRIGFFLICIMQFFAPQNVTAEESAIPVLVFERSPYYVYGHGKFVSGVVADPIAEAFKVAGIPFVWEPLAANLHLREIQANERPVCAAGWFKNSDRESYARFSDPVYLDKPMIVLARKDNTEVLSSLTFSDLIAKPNLKLLTKPDFSYGEEIDTLIEGSAVKIRTITQGGLDIAERILRKKEDFTIMSPEELVNITSKLGLRSKHLIQLSFPEFPEGNARHIICSMKVPVGKIELLNQALIEIAP